MSQQQFGALSFTRAALTTAGQMDTTYQTVSVVVKLTLVSWDKATKVELKCVKIQEKQNMSRSYLTAELKDDFIWTLFSCQLRTLQTRIFYVLQLFEKIN